MINLARKKVVIVDKELTPTVLAIKKDRKKTSILSVFWLVIIFAIFIAGAIYLPDISKYVNNYLNPDINIPSVSDNPQDNNDNNDVSGGTEVIKYTFSDTLEIKLDKIILKNFKLENNKLRFIIANAGTEIIDLNDYNYFLNLYDDSNKLFQRIMVNDKIVDVNENVTLEYDLVAENINYLTFYPVKIEEYPSYIVPANENGNATLVCKKENETVSYSLNNNKVYAIQDIYEVSATDANYAVLYSTYSALASTYDTIGGVTSNVNVENNILYFRTLINLNTVVAGAINNKIVYDKDTDAKIINFELEASGYDCNQEL